MQCGGKGAARLTPAPRGFIRAWARKLMPYGDSRSNSPECLHGSEAGATRPFPTPLLRETRQRAQLRRSCDGMAPIDCLRHSGIHPTRQAGIIDRSCSNGIFALKTETTELEGVLVITPTVHSDARGFFLESYRRKAYEDAGVLAEFIQDNHSFSARGTLRGLHTQYRKPQGKLIRVLDGEVFDVVVDARPDSATHGQHFSIRLSGENFRQLYVPPGYLHGFCVISESAHFLYKCTEIYDPDGELTVKWNDPTLAIDWPIDDPLISAKDANGMSLAQATDFLRAVS